MDAHMAAHQPLFSHELQASGRGLQGKVGGMSWRFPASVVQIRWSAVDDLSIALLIAIFVVLVS